MSFPMTHPGEPARWRALALPVAVAYVLLTALLLAFSLSDYMLLLRHGGEPVSSTGRLMLLYLPLLSVLTIPLALLFGTAFAARRAVRETADAGGPSALRGRAFRLALVLCLVEGVLLFGVMPRANHRLVGFVTQMHARAPDSPSAARKRSVREMDAVELIQAASRTSAPEHARRMASLEVHSRLSLVAACAAFAFLGWGLGFAGPRRAAAGLLACVAAAVGWYLLVAFGGASAEAGRLPPWLGAWLSLASLVAAALLLARRGGARLAGR